MTDLKLGIITQARVGSSRLPCKTLLEINGKSLLEYHFLGLQKSDIPIYLATTTEQDAHKLISIADQFSIVSKIGSLDDVLSRFYLCAKENKLDVIVRVTSDCPFISGELIKTGMNEYLSLPNWKRTYYSNTQNRIFPRGLDFEIFSFELLEEAYLNCLDMKFREHVTPYLYDSKTPSIDRVSMQYLEKDMSDWRLCVDTKKDFELTEKLILNHQLDTKSYKEMINILDENETLKKINKDIVQKNI